MSHPSRVRGLKFNYFIDFKHVDLVAPFAGAWIEIGGARAVESIPFVAPFAGAWIEILSLPNM